MLKDAGMYNAKKSTSFSIVADKYIDVYTVEKSTSLNNTQGTGSESTHSNIYWSAPEVC